MTAIRDIGVPLGPVVLKLSPDGKDIEQYTADGRFLCLMPAGEKKELVLQQMKGDHDGSGA